MDQHSIQETAARFRRLYTAAVYDILDEMGLPAQCLDLGIKPLETSMRVAGPAFTILGMPDPRTPEEVAQERVINSFPAFPSMYPGCVVVMATGGDRHCGQWDELLSNAAIARGAVGAVLDGGTRDTTLLTGLGDFAVFCRYASPIQTRKRYRVRLIEEPIYVGGTLTSHLRVEPGDWVFADRDGVILIPKALVPEVLAKAEEAKATENDVREAVRRGEDLRDVVARFGRI